MYHLGATINFPVLSGSPENPLGHFDAYVPKSIFMGVPITRAGWFGLMKFMCLFGSDAGDMVKTSPKTLILRYHSTKLWIVLPLLGSHVLNDIYQVLLKS